MADKKFGQKRVCSNCEVKFYDLNKKSPFICPHCNSEIVIDDEQYNFQPTQVSNQQKKIQEKNDLSDLQQHNDEVESSEDVISLDDVEVEEENIKS